MEKIITITVDGNIDYAISDILCRLEGYLAGAKEGYGNLLSPAIKKIRNLNIELKDKLKKLESEGK